LPQLCINPRRLEAADGCRKRQRRALVSGRQQRRIGRMNFVSDNAYGAAPEILAAVVEAAKGSEPSYGEDRITARVTARFREIFEREVAVFPVVTGTAANALALATISPPYGAIFCYAESHIVVDECAAPEFFSGGARLVPLPAPHAKLAPETIETELARYHGGVHSPKPCAISITQATERGTVYRPDEIAALSALSRRESMLLHMDGARFANALVSAGCTPAELTWKAGVDVLSFGATKNGALCAEAVVFFDPAQAKDFEYRRKRGGHLLSKMRFVSAQLEAYLAEERWLKQARRANALASRMANELGRTSNVELAHPAEANEIFAHLPDAMVSRLREAGARFYDWGTASDGRKLVRLVLSFLTPEADIARFLEIASGA
jgi:threonine aldolase